ncbi:DUF2614 family zinc ribbon-containing protein [Paenibacillus sp. PL2-23]|uniref:DUF2614 family zinc ribbon-containing protein n=1 Tax=Paenibacillus sp. PL2-23 TaxID=2100729 RepID=UPI00349ECF4A
MLVFLLICIIIGVVLALVITFIRSVIAVASPSIECPACARKIKFIGNSGHCYKCRSKIYKHSNGTYMTRQ